jgi:AAA domain
MSGPSFTDLSKEAAIAGSIAVGTFELIPTAALIPVDAFADPRWHVIYAAAIELRSQISNQIICAESVTDFIAFHDLERDLQRAIDSANTINWRRWPEFADTSLAFAATTRPLEYCLHELAYLYCKRQAANIGGLLVDNAMDIPAAIGRLQTLNQSNGAHPGRPLVAFADVPPDPAKTLLGNRFLCREGGMLFVGPSGIGKTAASVQQDLLWSIGQPAFGIMPARALKILTIQAEDDDGDLSEIVTGIKAYLEFSADQIKLSSQNCVYVCEKSVTSTAFLEQIVAPLLFKYQPDILRINPLQAYLGGDLKEPAITAAFLRNGLNPLLVTHQCGVILVHHTPKTNFRNTEEWKASDWMYAGAGAADITNWARAALVIDPTDQPHVFRFIAAKRGSRIGWANDEGDSIVIRHFNHSQSGSIFWQQTDETQIPDQPRKASGQFQNKFEPNDIIKLLSAIDGLSVKTIRSHASEELGMSKATFFRLWNVLKSSGKISQHDSKWFRS